VKAPYPMAPAPAYFNWTGFYIGGNVGGAYASTSGTGTTVLDATGFPAATSYFSASGGAGGVIGGGQIGANYQFTNHWVIGVEADIDGASVSGSSSQCSFNTAGTAVGCATTTNKLNDFGTVRGRLGYAGDNLLFYGTGGWAWAQGSTSSNLTCAIDLAGGVCPGTSVPFTGGSTSGSTTANGWAAGAGIEYAFARNWIARVEYLHLQFNNVASTLASTGTIGGVAFTATTGSSATTNIDIGRVGLSFLFH
jgi:outer membrane immunogenic protein